MAKRSKIKFIMANSKLFKDIFILEGVKVRKSILR
jgi:hypothetical protein